MHIDFKVTSWERVVFDKEHEEAVLEALKNKTINCSNDLVNFLAERGDHNFDCDNVLESNEQMTLEENDNQSTIEFYGDKIENWSNGE
jgi:hypothetical protein